MNHPQGFGGGDDHDELSSLVPWYVNETIGDLDRQRLDLHLLSCAACRAELHQERLIHQRMSANAGIEYMPAPSLNRLRARLDKLPHETARFERGPVGMPRFESSSTEEFSPHVTWQLRASMAAVLVIALGMGATTYWLQIQSGEHGAEYHTVTSAATRPPNEVIRAVFSPAITLVELQAILDESQLRIISGPTEAGVYSLATTSVRPVASSLAILRQHSSVRFAEGTAPLNGPTPSR